jgi:anti-anti-sigma regulatory factor
LPQWTPGQGKGGHMKTSYTWKFPTIINFFEVPEYLNIFMRIKRSKEIIFDLTETRDINSSFIGFLIYAKEHLKSSGRKPVFIKSPHVEKTFALLGMKEYFLA